MIIACYIVLFVYAASICFLLYGYVTIPGYSAAGTTPKTKFSIVVPYRNEAENLPQLLKSFSNLQYPAALFEVILVDDASDVTFRPKDFRFKVTMTSSIRISNSPKKDAINTAIGIAQNDWIITTDADCRVPERWLGTIDSFIQQNNPQMIAGAVACNGKGSFLDHFQQIELASLQVTTIGSFGLGYPFMCNGANFAYAKSFFHELNGFIGNGHIASGDDVFLLQKAIAHFPDRVFYLKSENNTVTTKPADSWKELFYQRVRWVSKSGSYHGYFGQLLGLIVFMGNLSYTVLFLSVFLGEFSVIEFFYTFFLKSIFDFMLAYRNSSFVKSTPFFIPAGFLYPFLSVAVALYSLCGKYQWKGRTFRK
jgi:glycosyltransferase involved in cell wall biosynthesis